jgi:hypothetical protein
LVDGGGVIPIPIPIRQILGRWESEDIGF